jgi:RHS repeat-associated protein
MRAVQRVRPSLQGRTVRVPVCRRTGAKLASLCHQRARGEGLDRHAIPALASLLGRSGGKQSTGLFSFPPHPGQWFQSESGLHQNWMRDYDPTTGRYLQPDPLGLVDGASVYGYAGGNPGRWVDPRGEEVKDGWRGGRACNFSSKAVLVWSDREGYVTLCPNDCTTTGLDSADFVGVDGDWYKCPGGRTCRVSDNLFSDGRSVSITYPRTIVHPFGWPASPRPNTGSSDPDYWVPERSPDDVEYCCE